MTCKDAMEILGLKEPVTQDAIKAAYRNLSKKVHPDVGGNDFLFKMIHCAYELLYESSDGSSSNTYSDTKSDTESKEYQNTNNHNQNSQQKTHYKRAHEMSWDEIIRQDDFHIDFNTFARIVLLGETLNIPYKNYSVPINPTDVEFHTIKTWFPINITVCTWSSRLAKLLGKKARKVSPIFVVSNGYNRTSPYAASRYFRKNLTTTVQAGYHEITLEYLNHKQVIKTKTKKAYDIRKFEKELVLNGVHDIHVNICINVITETK